MFRRCVHILILTWAIAVMSPAPTWAEDKPDVIGMKFYADWCGYCKYLDPKLKSVMPDFEGQPILFHWFDLTDDERIAKATAEANELGVADVFATRAPQTGFMLLVDTSTNTVIDELRYRMSKEEIRERISAALAHVDRG